MTRFEQQEQICREIQSVETELADCPAGSSRRIELYDRLNGLLREYTAVPRDSTVRPHTFRGSFRQCSHMFRVQIWLTVVLTLISFPMVPMLNHDFPWIFPIWFITLLLTLVWAVWSSCPLKE